MIIGPKLTKDALIELIKDYPGDTPIVVAIAQPRNDGAYAYLTDGGGRYDNQPVVWSVADAEDRIVLEL